MALDTTRRNQYGRNWKSEWLRSGLALSCIAMFLRWYFHDSPGTSFVSNRCIYVQLRMYVRECLIIKQFAALDWKLEKGAIVKCNGSWEYLIINRSLRAIENCGHNIELLCIRGSKVIYRVLFSIFWIFVRIGNRERSYREI